MHQVVYIPTALAWKLDTDAKKQNSATGNRQPTGGGGGVVLRYYGRRGLTLDALNNSSYTCSYAEQEH